MLGGLRDGPLWALSWRLWRHRPDDHPVQRWRIDVRSWHCGDMNSKAWLRRLLRISGGDAQRRVKVARQVPQRTAPTGEPLAPELPATAEALRDGEVGLDQARTRCDTFVSAICPSFENPLHARVSRHYLRS